MRREEGSDVTWSDLWNIDRHSWTRSALARGKNEAKPRFWRSRAHAWGLLLSRAHAWARESAANSGRGANPHDVRIGSVRAGRRGRISVSTSHYPIRCVCVSSPRLWGLLENTLAWSAEPKQAKLSWNWRGRLLRLSHLAFLNKTKSQKRTFSLSFSMSLFLLAATDCSFLFWACYKRDVKRPMK